METNAKSAHNCNKYAGIAGDVINNGVNGVVINLLYLEISARGYVKITRQT